MTTVVPKGERTLRGIPVSAGVCRGKILVLCDTQNDAVLRRDVPEEEVPEQIRRLEQALAQTRKQILEVQRQVNQGLGAAEASIFDAHLLVLEDPTLIEEVTRLLGAE